MTLAGDASQPANYSSPLHHTLDLLLTLDRTEP